MHIAPKVVNTFVTDTSSGSPQLLYFFSSLSELKLAYEKNEISDEFDHSFVFVNNSGECEVYWRNRAGRIQFCGSGAYAIAWYILHQSDNSNLIIRSESQQIFSAKKVDNHVFLSINAKSVSQIDNNLYTCIESGIFLHKLKSLEEIKDDLLVKNLLKRVEKNYSPKVHGFCVFFWKDDIGHLRYFTPWHGRDEDYVTGSIHQYLSPLIAQENKIDDQVWIQYSNLGGSVLTQVDQNQVILSGQCTF